MPIIKEGLAITLAAGILTAGVAVYGPFSSSRTSAPAARPVFGAPSAIMTNTGEMTEANDRLREALVASHVARQAAAPLPAVLPSQAAPHPLAGPPMPEALALAINQVTLEGAAGDPAAQSVANAGAVAGATGAPWVPTPRPELIAKADARFDNGDVAGARLWLEAALDEGDADAAFRLAETYDPAVLAEWVVIGIASDVPKARALYERAANGGVKAASQRVARLSK